MPKYDNLGRSSYLCETRWAAELRREKSSYRVLQVAAPESVLNRVKVSRGALRETFLEKTPFVSKDCSCTKLFGCL